MPAATDAAQRPTYETLQGTKPREWDAVVQRFYGELSAVGEVREGIQRD
jgi:hypothetical protein